MSKLILFPNVGRIEPFETFKGAKTVVNVTHRLELIPPVERDDYFRLRDHLGAEVQIIATLKSGSSKEPDTEAIVRRFTVDVPPMTAIFLDSEFFKSLGKKLQNKLKQRAWKVTRYLELKEQAAQYQFEEQEAHQQPSFGASPTTLSLPSASPHGMMPPRRRIEVSQQDVMEYESALRRFSMFMSNYNGKHGHEVTEYKLGQFFSLLADMNTGSSEVFDAIRGIENRIANEVKNSVQILG